MTNSEHPSPPSKDALRILVVDDDLDTAQSMTYLLLDLGHQVMFTNNGDSAVEIARRFLPQVVFLDLVLPDIEGLALARTLRGLPGIGAVHIYAVTGYSEEHARSKNELVFDDHFLKPMPPEALDRLVGRVQWNSEVQLKTA